MKAEVEAYIENILERVDLDFSFSPDSRYVSMASIPLSHEWSEPFPGMIVRLMDIEYISDGTVVECVATSPMTMDTHHHKESETLFLLSGTMVDEITGSEIHGGESIQFKAYQPHKPKFPEPSVCIIIWRPPLRRYQKQMSIKDFDSVVKKFPNHKVREPSGLTAI